MYSRSQFGQDQQVLNVFKKLNGFFVEVGAYDGVNMSNTYLLEQQYNWKGICIEPNPRYFQQLMQNRPNCINLSCAAYNENDKQIEFIDHLNGGCSAILETNCNTHMLQYPLISVKTKKLTTILEECNAPNFIEFLSIDTEGSEFEILNAHNFDKYLFGYICVEHNFIASNREKIRSLLESKGYIYVRENNVDDDYIHKSLVSIN
jgi:FkbM family methyltransferase